MLLDIDAGEGESEELWPLADILNVACGGHAGDARSMERLVACASRALGAHPSYPDRATFGRVSVAMDPGELARVVRDQCASLASIARARGARVTHAKAHGALYHDANAQEPVARAFFRGVTEALGADVLVLGPPRGELSRVARELGVGFLREGFADRATRADGSLVPRSEPGALVTDPREAAAIALRMRAARDIDAVCVHGDGPAALAVARAVREALSSEDD